MDHSVLTFQNTNYSIKAEQTLLSAKIPVTVIPLPSAIHAGCGLSIRICAADLARARESLAQAGVPIQGAYMQEQAEGGVSYTLCPPEK